MGLYDSFMTLYFATYGSTMVANAELFWGKDSIMMLPYMASSFDEQAAFFARMTGFGFLLLVAGRVLFGVSPNSFAKQTVMFHLGTIPLFYANATSGTDAFTDWVWKLQIALNVVFGLWGAAASSNKQKSD